MPRPRFTHLSAERREAYLAAAGDEFARRGFTGASLNRIIARAGTSKGAFYYYFEDKADLLGTVAREALARVMAEVAWPEPEELTAATFWDRLRDINRHAVRLMEADTWYMRVLRAFHRLREEPGARDATAGFFDATRGVIAAFFRSGRELGVVRTDLPLDLLVEMHLGADAAGDAWMMRHWSALSDTERVALMDARIDLVRDMLDAQRMGWDR